MDAVTSNRRDDERRSESAPGETPPSPITRETRLRHSRLRRIVGTVLAVYWLLMFVAMHVRISHSPVSIPGADKVVHFVGYGVLGLLLTLWVALRRPLSGAAIMCIVAVLAAYGIIDELLQIPVGRDFELADWASDLMGGGLGTLAMTVFCRRLPRANSE